MNIRPYESLQEVFDVAYRGLAAQGFHRAMQFNPNRDRTTCSYRSNGDMKCAIGHCVPDELVTNQVRFASVGAAIVADSDWQALFANVSVDVLKLLQGVHDNGFTPESMKERLEHFAEKFGLTIPIVL